MATIDKSLPNEIRKEETIPATEEFQQEVEAQVEEQIESPEDIEIVENEDGSVDIDYDPNAASPEGGQDHYANLAEFLPDEVLGKLGNELYGNYLDYKNSRKDWES